MLLRRRDLWPLLGFVPRMAGSQPNGAALLLRIADRKLLMVDGADSAATCAATPGSTVKPFTVFALLKLGKLKPSDEYVCPGRLVLNGRNMSCSHPAVTVPMNAARAIAYSCNCAIAQFAQRLQPGELPDVFRGVGLSSSTNLMGRSEATGGFSPALHGQQLQLQALGERFVTCTPLELLVAYRALAQRVHEPEFAPVLEGLEGAVEYGSAQKARVETTRVAGKTGTVRDGDGVPFAWFAGFAPSRAPEVVVTVLVQGHAGGADAAPIAAHLLRSHFAGRA